MAVEKQNWLSRAVKACRSGIADREMIFRSEKRERTQPDRRIVSVPDPEPQSITDWWTSRVRMDAGIWCACRELAVLFSWFVSRRSPRHYWAAALVFTGAVARRQCRDATSNTKSGVGRNKMENSTCVCVHLWKTSLMNACMHSQKIVWISRNTIHCKHA